MLLFWNLGNRSVFKVLKLQNFKKRTQLYSAEMKFSIVFRIFVPINLFFSVTWTLLKTSGSHIYWGSEELIDQLWIVFFQVSNCMMNEQLF